MHRSWIKYTLPLGLCFALFGMSQLTAGELGPLGKLLKTGKLPRERQAAVAEMLCQRGNAADMALLLAQASEADRFDASLRIKILTWLGDAAAQRKAIPEGDLAKVQDLVRESIDKQDVSMQLAALRLASIWKVREVLPNLKELATSRDADPAARHLAIDGLASMGGEESALVLKQLSGSDWPMPTRQTAIAALTILDVKGAAEAAAIALGESLQSDDPSEMIDAFLRHREGSDLLADAISEKNPLPDVAKMALRHMYSVGRSDAKLSSILSTLAGVGEDPPIPTPEEVQKIVAEVLANGDPVRGEKVFRRAEVSCMRCHSLARAGGNVGPELSAIGGTSPVDYVVNSILNPSLAIKEQYLTRTFITVNGEIITGIVLQRNDKEVKIRDASGKEETIPAEDIDEEAAGKSLMPQGITKFLKHDEVIDLIRFVSELGKPGPYAVRQVPSMQRWKQLISPAHELLREVPNLELIRQHIHTVPVEGWKSVYGLSTGELPLEELASAKGKSVIYLRGEFDLSQDAPVVPKVRCDSPLTLWIDSQNVDPAAEISLSLEKGRHTVLCRLEIGGKSVERLYVEIRPASESSARVEVVGGP